MKEPLKSYEYAFLLLGTIKRFSGNYFSTFVIVQLHTKSGLIPISQHYNDMFARNT